MTVDITAAIYQVPEVATDPMYQVLQPLTVAALTTGSPTGTGVYDLLMVSVKSQLAAEYENGRITGSEYTKAYIEMSQSAMQTALQFVLGRDAAFWTAQTAQIQAVTGRVALETARYTYQNVLPEQLAMATSQAQAAAFGVNSTLPAQLQLIQEQADAQRGQTSNTRLDGSTIGGTMGEQKALYAQQIVSYQRDAEMKCAKVFTDAWITSKTIDNGLLPPQGFTNDSVNEVLAAIMGNNFPGMTPVA